LGTEIRFFPSDGDQELLTLFGTLDSGNVHKVQMILGRIGETYRRVDVAQTRNEPRDEKYRAINPMGKVPAVLLEDGRVLTESGAILYYFAQGTPLWPKGVDEQTEILRWMFFEQYSHEPSLAVMRYLRHFAGGSNPNTNRIAELEPKARRALTVMESQLNDKTWLAADGCTIADYALYPYTRAADSVGFDIAGYPGIEGWLARVESQPGFIPMGSETAVETLTFAEYFRP
jgi:glutathione S-transferase